MRRRSSQACRHELVHKYRDANIMKQTKAGINDRANTVKINQLISKCQARTSGVDNLFGTRNPRAWSNLPIEEFNLRKESSNGPNAFATWVVHTR